MSFYLSYSVSVILLVGSWLCILSHSHNTPITEANENSLVDLLDVAHDALQRARKHAKNQIRTDPNLLYFNPMDCAEIYEKNSSTVSGLYKIWPRSRFSKTPINVYCDMHDDGGAWTVIQRRGDFESAKDYFYRDWKSYKIGFGDSFKDFWIGSDNIFSLTNERVNSVKFELSDWDDNSTYAIYDEFWIDDEDHNYTLHVAGYRGTAGDGFISANGQAFSTKDKDNDKHPENCAVKFTGAWWYTACHSSNLNGQYFKGSHESYADGVNWRTFRGNHYSLKSAVIKIRPKDFVKTMKLDATPK